MIKKRFIILIILCMTIAGRAQNYYSVLNDVNNSWEYYLNHIQVNDSSSLVFGCTKDFFANDSSSFWRLFVDRLDKNGQVTKRFLHAYPEREFHKMSSPFILNDKIAIIDIQKDLIDSLNNDVILHYLDSSGNIIYSKYLNAEPLGGYLVKGFSINKHFQFTFCISYGKFASDSFYLTSTDTLGNLLWIKEYPSIHKNVISLLNGKNGTFFTCGYLPEKVLFVQDSQGFLKYTGNPRRLWLSKFDSLGNVLWQKIFEGEYYEPKDSLFYQFGPKTQGAGFSGILSISDETYIGYGQVNFYPYLVCFNEDGDIIWERKFDVNRLDSLTQKIHGGGDFFREIVLVNNYLYAIGQKHEGNNNFVYKMTLSGKIVWRREYLFQEGIFNQLGSIVTTSDGFVLLGSARDSSIWSKQQDAWIIKIDTNGCLMPGCGNNDIIDTLTAINNVNYPEKDLRIYPNPADKTIYIYIEFEAILCQIFDFSGKEIFVKQLYRKDGSYIIPVDGLDDGLYFIKITSLENGIYSNKKILIKH